MYRFLGEGWNPPTVGIVRKAPARVAMAKVMPGKGGKAGERWLVS